MATTLRPSFIGAGGNLRLGQTMNDFYQHYSFMSKITKNAIGPYSRLLT
jgi:hypothetical protein